MHLLTARQSTKGSGNGWRRMIYCRPNSILNLILFQVCLKSYLNPILTQSQQAIYASIISCFPQMKPETPTKAPAHSKPEEYLALGVPVEWVEPLQKLGYTTIDKLKELEKPGKLANDLNGYKKKNKLDLPGLSPEIVGEWIKS
jgi:hypothetical protein